MCWLWSDKNFFIPWRGASYAGYSSVKMPKRVRTPAMAIASRIDPRIFENCRRSPFAAILPKFEVAEKQICAPEFEVRLEKIMFEINSAACEIRIGYKRVEAALCLIFFYDIRQERKALLVFAK